MLHYTDRSWKHRASYVLGFIVVMISIITVGLLTTNSKRNTTLFPPSCTVSELFLNQEILFLKQPHWLTR